MKIVLLLIIIFMSIELHASACANHVNEFNKKYTLYYRSLNEVELMRKQFPKRGREIVKLQGEFASDPDKHSRIQYSITSITSTRIKVSFVSTFDARSFGGELQACGGEIDVKPLGL